MTYLSSHKVIHSGVDVLDVRVPGINHPKGPACTPPKKKVYAPHISQMCQEQIGIPYYDLALLFSEPLTLLRSPLSGWRKSPGPRRMASAWPSLLTNVTAFFPDFSTLVSTQTGGSTHEHI